MLGGTGESIRLDQLRGLPFHQQSDAGNFGTIAMTTFQGSCHCGGVRFEVDAAEIDHVRVCDCSVCKRRGALIHRVPKDSLHLLTPWDGLSTYQWGSRTAVDYFCPVCGILPFRIPSAPTPDELTKGVARFEGWAINVRCLEGVDFSRIPIEQIHGSGLKYAV